MTGSITFVFAPAMPDIQLSNRFLFNLHDWHQWGMKKIIYFLCIGFNISFTVCNYLFLSSDSLTEKFNMICKLWSKVTCKMCSCNLCQCNTNIVLFFPVLLNFWRTTVAEVFHHWSNKVTLKQLNTHSKLKQKKLNSFIVTTQNCRLLNINSPQTFPRQSYVESLNKSLNNH